MGLTLLEEDLVKNGKHVWVAFSMTPKAGYNYLSTASHFAAESEGYGGKVCTIGDSMQSVDALVHYIDPGNTQVKIAYPCLWFGLSIKASRAMMVAPQWCLSLVTTRAREVLSTG